MDKPWFTAEEKWYNWLVCIEVLSKIWYWSKNDRFLRSSRICPLKRGDLSKHYVRLTIRTLDWGWGNKKLLLCSELLCTYYIHHIKETIYQPVVIALSHVTRLLSLHHCIWLDNVWLMPYAYRRETKTHHLSECTKPHRQVLYQFFMAMKWTWYLWV